MISKKTWEEFYNTGFLLYINQILHLFGWAIVYQVTDSGYEVFPARVKFRAFESDAIDKSYINMTNYLNENVKELLEEVNE